MRSSFILILLGLVYCLVAAAPFQKRSFKVERKRNIHFKGYNGPRELLKAYRKYNRPLPPALLEALKSRGGKPPAAQSTQSKMGTGFGGDEPFEPGIPPYGPGVPTPEQQGPPFVEPSTPVRPPGPDDPTAQGKPTASAPPPGYPSSNGWSGIDSTLPPITLTGLVAATPETNDVEYLSPVTIGMQTLHLDFDTGSSDLWVFNTLLPAASTPGHALFDPAISSTFRLLPDTTFSITYGDDSGASGVVGRDAVTVGGVQVPDQAVELATNVSGSFVEDVRSAGILGLAFSKLNTVQPEGEKTFFENLMPTLAEPVFTADLRSGGAVGAYEFGRVDPDKFRGEMAWVGVDASEGFWQFETAGFAVGEGRNVAGLAGGPGQAIVDTGTTLMLVAQDVSDGYYKQVEGAKEDPKVGGVTFPCDAELPDLFVDVGGVYMAKVKGEDIRFAEVDDDVCFGGVQPLDGPLQIWGDIFFKSQFVAFNGGNQSLGIAEHV
ncbi:penicillopepsin [Schizothecium vesticola]|uniref:Penicillopepsin n=1 Tax=Schizothecium vesticola TaxID=314040 RepID=A0AA40K5U6_9PEZI|nr:penicillopepsin [Schizothecium vesticola]